MPISEAERADLYTGLTEVIGQRRAEILMSAIAGMDHVATKSDIVEVRSELNVFRSEMKVEIAELRAEFKADFTRLSFILVAGFLGIIATLIGVGILN
jgi:hypothetical protein